MWKKPKTTGLAVGCILIGLTALSTPSLAGDGVIEINQASANAGAITPGDGNGFPVTLNEPGSYRLTGNLVVPFPHMTAIDVRADHVTIDLNGFAIVGPTVCAAECSPTGVGNGVSAAEEEGSFPTGTTVLNGTIRGMGHRGIWIYGGGHVAGVQAISNGGDGIRVGSESVVTDNRSHTNGGHGIFASNSCVVTRNAAVSNFGDGIFAAQASTVRNNTARANLGIGIDVNNGSLVTENAAWQNVGAGIDAGAGATVTNNSSYDNGGFGLDLDAGAGYGGNVLRDNTGGEVTAAGVEIGQNLCGADTICP